MRIVHEDFPAHRPVCFYIVTRRIVIDACTPPGCRQAQRIFKKRSFISKSLASQAGRTVRERAGEPGEAHHLPSSIYRSDSQEDLQHTDQFAFRCETKQWAATTLTINKLEVTDDGKLIDEPIIHC
jgi:hypothetical protein